MSEVNPLSSFASFSIPTEISNLTCSKSLNSDALISEVLPELSFASILAPIELRYSTIARNHSLMQH